MNRRQTTLILALVVLVTLAFALLYAYRSQAPAAKEIPYSLAVTQVEQGGVHRVVVSGQRARVTLRDGVLLDAAVPERDDSLARAVGEWNRANPTRTSELRYEEPSPFPALAGSVLLSLLPVALLGLLIVLLARSLVRSRAPDRYEGLSRLADLRDRGALTEDEFQKEKRRILG